MCVCVGGGRGGGGQRVAKKRNLMPPKRNIIYIIYIYENSIIHLYISDFLETEKDTVIIYGMVIISVEKQNNSVLCDFFNSTCRCG